MSGQLIQDPIPWTAEEEAILIDHWEDPEIDFVGIAKLLPDIRTREAVQRRGREMGLGPKAQQPKSKKSKKDPRAWPDDMPKFEDHPLAAAPGSPARAALLGSRLKSLNQREIQSLTGSSLEGASPQGLLVDE